MVFELKLQKVGDAVGMILPEEALAALKASEGDSVRVTQDPDGAPRITAANFEVASQMKAADEIIRRYPETLRDLAK